MDKPMKLLKVFGEVAFIIVSYPILVFLALFVLVFLIPANIYRLIVIILAKLLHPDWVEILRGGDAMMAADNLEKPQSSIIWYNTLDGQVSLEEISKNFDERIIKRKDPATGKLLYPGLQQYYEEWMGYNFRKWDTSFDIRSHIKLLPGSGESVLTTETQLLSALGELNTSAFTPKRPYWEMFCVPNFVKHGESISERTALVFRFHHGICDGYSVIKILVKHLCDEDLSKIIKYNEKKRMGNPILQMLKTIWYLFKIPYTVLKFCVIVDSNAWFLPKSELTRDVYLSMTKKIPLASIKAICKKYKVCLPSVLFSALAGGINQHFRKKNAETLPGAMHCGTSFPWKNHPDDELVNHWSGASISIFPGIDCPEERLYKTERKLKVVKTSPMPLIFRVVIQTADAFPVTLLKHGNQTISTMLSSLPGPKEYLRWYGKYKIDDILFWVPHLMGKAGIGFSTMSYGDSLRYGVCIDKAILSCQKDVDDLCLYIEDELQKLFNEVGPIKNEDSSFLLYV